MTLRARVALVKRVPAGEGVSYGHEWTTPRETTLALLPIGYADGVPRALNRDGADAGAAGRARCARSSGGCAWTRSSSTAGTTRCTSASDAVLFGPGRRR